MANFAVINPGLYHYGHNYPNPPYQKRRYREYLEPFKNVQFKTSVLHNRRIYIGNVKVTYTDGTVETLGDTMFKSSKGHFDRFTKRGRIDVAVGDGENIIKLETYADRILQFKDKTLHVINAAGKLEFIEDSFKYKGVDNPQAVARTDYGIAWVNSFGCYIYDGKEIHDLLEDGIKRKINKSTWSDFVSPTSMVGYSPSKRQIIIIDSYLGADSNGHIYLYDIPTRSWIQGQARVAADDKSNFIIKNSDDRTTSELIYSKNFLDSENSNNASTRLQKWLDNPVAGAINIQLKDEDFGHPHVRKKVHKIYLTAKYGQGVTLSATPDGGAGSNLTFDTTDLNTGGTWGKTEHKVTANGNNIYSLQLKLSGTTISDSFEINDISVVYRAKGIK